MSEKPIIGTSDQMREASLRYIERQAVRWLVWSEEHRGYWPQSRCGYVPLSEAGRFTYDEALSIVTQGNYGMGSIPEESMLPVPHPTILERAALAEKGKP